MAEVAHIDQSAIEAAALINENARFKAKYAVYLRRATYIALAFYVVVFFVSPKYVPTPYKLREEKIEIIDIPDAIDIPPPPKEIPRPQVPIEAAPDAEVDEDIELAETLPDDWDLAPPPQAGGGLGSTGNQFVAFDTKPEIVKGVAPDYPETARDLELAGKVYVNVLVGTDGRVKQAEVSRGLHPILDRAAVAAAYRWLFTPGKQRDIPVEVWVTIPFNFTLH